MAEKRFCREMEFESKASQPAVMSAIMITLSDRNEHWWTDGYQNWDEVCYMFMY